MKSKKWKGTKGNLTCLYCGDKIFNMYSHVRSNHKNLITEYLKSLNFDYRICKKCNKTIIPRYKKNCGIYYFDEVNLFGEKLKRKRLLCEECEKKIVSHNAKMESVWGINSNEYENYHKKANLKKAITEDNLIKKYGKDEGETRYKKFKESQQGRYTTKWWIEKHGEIEGLKKQQEWKNKTGTSLKRFIEKFGNEEGIKKHKEFKEKCSIFSSHRIEKFGEQKYNDSFNKWKNRKNSVSFNYFLEKNNGDYEQALKCYKERQATSTLEKFIKKHGKEEGEIKYKEVCKKKSMSLESFINKHGEEEGRIKYKKNCSNMGYSLEKCINKHGKEEGTIIYQKIVKSKTSGFEGKSKIEFEFLTELNNEIKNDFTNICFGDNKHFFFTTEEIRKKYNKKVFIPDFYIKDIKICVEVFGDFWHMNPIIYNENDINAVFEKSAKEVWEADAERLTFLKNHYNVNTIVVWEKEIKTNKNAILKEIKEKINEFSKITNQL